MTMGKSARVTVTSVEHYGAFATGELGDVLVLLPELSETRCSDARLIVSPGDEMFVELLNRNPENGVFRARRVRH